LTVITNAVNIAAELAGTDFEVVLVGGTLRKNSFSLVGPLAEDNLQEMHADILFLGVDGFDLEVGITTPNFLESRVNRAMVKASRKVVVVCDSSKFNHRSLSRIMPPDAIHYLITDRNLPSADVDALRAHNIEVTLV
jgi:DeoR family transcriptional regulator of aga operon